MDREDFIKWPGLSDAQAKEKLGIFGFNEIASQKKSGFFKILAKIVFEPMILLLVGGGIVYLFVGDIREALMLLSFVFVVVGITFYQEQKTENTLDKLRSYSSPRALVIRNGERKRISGKDVVPEDIVILQEGDRVPADCVVLKCENLLIDESLLTGESVSVRKTAWDGVTKNEKPGGDDLPFVFSGTMVVAGQGFAQVISTGANSEIGKIGTTIQHLKYEDTLLHKEIYRIVKYFAFTGFLLCFTIFSFYAITKGQFVKGLLSGITLGMAILPEEFPVILVIFLTLGAWRISKNNVLTRRPEAIETLGAATTLCVDKTGTLTMNKMKLSGFFVNNNIEILPETDNPSVPEKYFNLIDHALLASQRYPFDPLEKEIKEVFQRHLAHKDKIYNEWKLVREYPLSKEHLSICHVWKATETADNEYTIAIKGAPEAVIDLCHLSKIQAEEILLKVYEMANKGFRVLGVANAMHKGIKLPDSRHEYNFQFLGLLGFIDPVRESVAESIKEAYTAGIRTIMITGDYPGTALFVAKKIGLKNPSDVITGTQLDNMTSKELNERIKTVNVFARVIPEQKLTIVNALKKNGEIVAMTGDGVNDAPALKSANIGIAMGERGTDVAREAAALVLLDDDFNSIVTAVRLGRRIYENIKKAISYTLAIHIPIAGMAIIPLLLHYPEALLPAHIAFLELIIDPACSTVFESEPEESNTMLQPPRKISQPIFGKASIIWSILQGLFVFLFVYFIYTFSINHNFSHDQASTFAFIALVASNLALILANLSQTRNIVEILKSKNKALYAVLLGTIVALVFILQIPFLRNLFHFSIVSPLQIVTMFSTGIITFLWVESGEIIFNKFKY